MEILPEQGSTWHNYRSCSACGPSRTAKPRIREIAKPDGQPHKDISTLVIAFLYSGLLQAEQEFQAEAGRVVKSAIELPVVGAAIVAWTDPAHPPLAHLRACDRMKGVSIWAKRGRIRD